MTSWRLFTHGVCDVKKDIYCFLADVVCDVTNGQVVAIS